MPRLHLHHCAFWLGASSFALPVACADDAVEVLAPPDTGAGASASSDAGNGGQAGTRNPAGGAGGAGLANGGAWTGNGGASGGIGGNTGSAAASGAGGIEAGVAGGDAGTLSEDAGSDAGSGGVAPPLPIPGGVGAACTSNLDCPTNADGIALLTCLTATSDAAFGIGGPQGGYCSFPCAASEDCAAIDPFSGCITLPGGLRACAGACELGGAANALKCGADRAQACFPVNPSDAAVGGCLPMCTSDAACGSGRFCDNSATGLGLCRSAPPEGAPIGSPCDPETEADDCAGGVCLSFRGDDGAVSGRFCSAHCTYLSTEGCGFDAASGGPKDFACISPRSPDGGPGDLGFCLEVCDADPDCTQNDGGWVCNLFNDAATEAFVGRLGQCVPGALEGTEPPDAG